MTDIPDNPLAPDMLPARAVTMIASTDAPSTGTTRPFGLTRVTHLGDGEAVVVLEGISYDSRRQLNVDFDGRPFVDTPGVIHAGTSFDTQYDMTWVVDKD